MLEMGIVFHSVFVGIDLGIQTDPNTARALMIALIFHQVLVLDLPQITIVTGGLYSSLKLIITTSLLASACTESQVCGCSHASSREAMTCSMMLHPARARWSAALNIFGLVQGFEGLALGAALVRAQCDFTKFTLLALIFCVITPIGCAIGLGMGASYNDNGKTSLGFNGAFNSVSAGARITVV